MQCNWKIVHHGCINKFANQVGNPLNWLTLVPFSLHQMTPLHLAVKCNRTKMVECLLDKEADINLQDDNEVILPTNVVKYFEWQVLHPLFVFSAV